MAVNLPPELLGRVFKLTRADKQADLLTCIGICQAWRPLAERHLYEDIKLRNTRAARQIFKTLTRKPQLADHIRRLHLDFDASKKSIGAEIILLCPRLNALVLGIRTLLSVKKMLPELNITSFDLVQVYDYMEMEELDDDQLVFASGSEFIGLICCWSHIRSIRFRSDYSRDCIFPEPSRNRVFPGPFISRIFHEHIVYEDGTVLPNSMFLKLISLRSLPLRYLDICNLCLPVDGYRALLSLSLPQLEHFSTCVSHDDDGSDDAVLNCIDNWAHQLKSIDVHQGDADYHYGSAFTCRSSEPFKSRTERFVEIVNRMERLEFFGTDQQSMEVKEFVALSSPSLRHLIWHDADIDDLDYLTNALLEEEESANGNRRRRWLRSLESLLVCWSGGEEQEASLEEACKKRGISVMIITDMRKCCGREAARSLRVGELQPFVYTAD